MELKRMIKFLVQIPKHIGDVCVRLYQKTLSPDHGLMKFWYPDGFCKYYPSCSEYTRQAIWKNGLIIGSVRGAWRIIRCNPWSKGGIDNP